MLISLKVTSPPTKETMPNTTDTKRPTLRIPDDIKEAIIQSAKEAHHRKVYVTLVQGRTLRNYICTNKRQATRLAKKETKETRGYATTFIVTYTGNTTAMFQCLWDDKKRKVVEEEV
jgi:undecaprenyl pyrophosphate synthase